MLETAESQIAADLVREYLEHYKLDYTLSIFIPEANLKDTTPIDRNDVARKAGISSAADEPLLVSLIKHGKMSELGSSMSKKTKLEPLINPV